MFKVRLKACTHILERDVELCEISSTIQEFINTITMEELSAVLNKEASHIIITIEANN